MITVKSFREAARRQEIHALQKTPGPGADPAGHPAQPFLPGQRQAAAFGMDRRHQGKQAGTLLLAVCHRRAIHGNHAVGAMSRCGWAKKIEWDSPAMRAINAPEAAQYIKRENRAGWTLA